MQETQDFSALPVGWLLLLSLLALLFCIWAIVKIAEANQKQALSPQEKLIGQLGRVLSPISGTQLGKVHVFGEIWDAVGSDLADAEVMNPHTEVRIVGVDSVDPQVLRVERVSR